MVEFKVSESLLNRYAGRYFSAIADTITEDDAIRVVKEIPENILHIENPSKKIKLAAIAADCTVIRLISDPDEEMQMLVLNIDINYFDLIKKPCAEAINYVLERKPGFITSRYPDIIFNDEQKEILWRHDPLFLARHTELDDQWQIKLLNRVPGAFQSFHNETKIASKTVQYAFINRLIAMQGPDIINIWFDTMSAPFIKPHWQNLGSFDPEVQRYAQLTSIIET